MVRLLFISLILFATKSLAQTKVYAATPEGLPNKNSYCAFNFGKYFVCDSCGRSITDSSAFEEYRTVVFSDDHILINQGKSMTFKDHQMIFGYVTEEKKIFFAKVEKKDDKVNVSFEPSAEEIKNAPYYYDKKVYDANGTIIAVIEGDAKFGAVWYLLTHYNKIP